MTIYLAGFALATICYFLAERARGILSTILSTVGLLIPCLIAGMRDKTIGTDVSAYADWMFSAAHNLSLDDFIKYWSGNQQQPYGYVVLTWFIEHLTHNFNVYLFILQLIVIVPIYLTIKYYTTSTWLGMICYLTVIYPQSLNTLKQAIAVALVFYSLRFCTKKSPVKFVINIFFAYLFHQTAILGIILYPLYTYLVNIKKPFKFMWLRKYFVQILAGLMFAGIIVFKNKFISILVSIRGSYSYVADHQSQGTGFNETGFIFLILLASIAFFANKDVSRQKSQLSFECDNDYNKRLYGFILLLTVLGWCLLQLGIIGEGLMRVASYFQVFTTIYVGIIPSNHGKQYYRIIFKFMFLIFFIIYFVRTCLSGAEGVYPYTSVLLNIS